MKKVTVYIAALSFIVFLFLTAARFELIAKMQSVTDDNEKSSMAMCVAPPANNVAWYPGDGNTNDIIGSTNGTLQNGATFEAGKVGQAFSFDGVDDYVEFSDRSSLDISENLTIDVWIKPFVPLSQQAAYARIVDKLNFSQPPNTGYILFTNGNSSINPAKLCFEFYGTNGTQANVCTVEPDLAPTSTFTHVTGVYNQSSGIMRLYVNGQEKATANVGTLTISTNNVPLRLGNASVTVNNGLFKGAIDEVSIYSRALNQSEIQDIYNAGSAGMCKPEVTSTPTPTPGPAFVVTNTNDSGTGSFRQAILNANATTGAQTISFNIPGSGVQTIAPLSPLPDITEQVTIDGYTQPGSRPNTLVTGNNAVLLIELDGTNASAGGYLLRFYYPASNCIVRGLVMNRANSGTALSLFESGGNLIEGNFIGTDPTGMVAYSNLNGVQVTGSLANGNTIGGVTPAARNVISGNRYYGIAIGANNPQGNIIQGNYIGTNASGTAALPNGLVGISAEGTNFLIGGTATGAGNVIAGGQTAIELRTSLSSVQGNFIGTLADGITAAGPNDYGIAVGGNNNTIGGLNSGEGNIIAFSNKEGINVKYGIGHRILSNSIFGNSRLGIDLGDEGVTPNDAGDDDTGPNKLQNFPDLTAASSSGSNTIVQGTLNSTANTSFTVQFFSNPTCNTSDNNQGKIFIGSATVMTAGSGNAPFSTTLPVTVAPGHFITATATDPENNTSEFSACLPGPATAQPADLQVTNLTAPSQAFTDRPFDLSWTDVNNGQTRAEGPWTDKVFLSADNQLGGDTLLAEFTFIGSLDPSQNAARIQSITIPRASVPQDGQYHLIVVTDANKTVFEGLMEGNNVRVAPISVSRALLPDLIVEAIEAPNTAFFDQTITVRWTVKNNSNASTSASEWRDNLFLSSDRTLSGDDQQLLDVLNTTYLAAGERYVASADVRIPRGQFGTYYIIVKTDNNDEVFENNESNNTLDKAINIQIPPLPDLKVTNVIAPEETFVGGQIALTYRVENQGSRDTSGAGLPASWVDGVYLSQDQVLNEQTDRRIGECSHSGNLAQNQVYNANCTVDTPADVAGNWYVFVKTDDKNFIYEFVNENNNTNYDRAQPGSPMVIRATPPDLIVSATSAPANGTAARNVTVGWTVRNQGAFDATPSWFDKIYLSDDAVFSSTTDTPLASVSHGALAAGQEYTTSAEVRLPSCISGAKYIFVVTDSANQIFEYDPQINAEQNNVSAARAITISLTPADLRVTSVSNPNVGNAGQPIQVGWTVTNNGTGATIENSWFDQIYLSPTAAFNQNTALSIGSFVRQGNLNQGESYTRTENITVPNQAQGNYFVFVKTDANDSVEECANNGNNLAAGAMQININNNLPDLRISSVNPIGNMAAGSTITVNWTGQNAGNAPAQNSARQDAVYFSLNNTLDANDQRLASTIISGTLAVGASYQAQAQVTIPIVAPGSYFLIIKADDGNYVFEGQYENNNETAAALPIVVPEVDLQVSSFNAPATAYSGQTMNVTWTVINAGMNPTVGTNWTDYVYLSRDQVLDPTDQSIGYLSRQDRLLGGQSYNAALDVFVPAGFTGQWYLFVVTDRNNQIAESSENNNASTVRGLNLQLTPPADLTVVSVIAPSNSKPGEQTYIQWTVQNNGANAALGLWTDSVYLSTDQTWSINDVLIGQETRLGLNAGQSYNASLTAILPAMDLGKYYVIVRTDARNRVRETDETNNTGVSSGQTNVDVTQLQFGTPLNTTLKVGQERFYRTNAPADETVRFSIDGQNGSSNELFTRFGAMASRSQYDFLFNRPNEPDQEIVVPNTQAGNYFNLLRGDYVSPNSPTPNIENVSVKAEIIPFSITSVSPNRIGDNGQVTLTLNGAKFQNGATVKLVGNGATLTADKVTVINSATVKARFILTSASHGGYDVVLTNPSSTNTTATQAVTIETTKLFMTDLSVEGDTHPRAGRTISLDAVLSNSGNVDIPYVSMTSSFSANVSVETRRPANTFPRHANMRGTDSQKYGITNIRLNGITEDKFIVRDLEVGNKVSFAVNAVGFGSVPFKGRIESTSMSNDQYLSSIMYMAENARQLILEQPDFPPLPSDLATRINNSQQWWERLREVFIANGFIDDDASNKIAIRKDSSFRGIAGYASGNTSIDRFSLIRRCQGYNNCAVTVLVGAATCTAAGAGAVFGPPEWVVGAGGCISAIIATDVICYFDLLTNIGCDLTEPNPTCVDNIWRECSKTPQILDYPPGDPRNPPPPPSCQEVNYCPRVPADPNDKVGPGSFGLQEFISGQQNLPYTINFENVPTATAVAQRIRITDQLDPNLDWRTFRLKEIGFGSYRITVPENRAFFQQRIQLGAEFNNLLADINAGVDIATGKVTWTLTAIDLATGEQPNGASLGLLPPNNAANDGQGFVTYTVKPKATATTGTLIRNNATIVFDTEAPITTNTVSNTLDADLPTSAVNALPPNQSQTTFTVSWAGQDLANGSGLQSYDIWVSENDAPYQPFLSGTTDTTAQFTGQLGKTYRFYSIARDNAGNVESTPAAPDATTAYATPGFKADISPRPNGNNSIDADDIQQIRRFSVGLDLPYQSNEFQRADSSPRSTSGDGRVDADDIQQARRYSVGLDVKQPTSGQLGGGSALLFEDWKSTDKLESNSPVSRTVRAVNQTAEAGQIITVPINVDTTGDETGYTFSIGFDQTKLMVTNVSIGDLSGNIISNIDNTNGTLGLSVTSFSGANGTLAAAADGKLVTVTFRVAAGASAGTTDVAFTDNLTRRKVTGGDPNTPLAQPGFSNGTVTITGSAATVSVSVGGRVMTREGRGIRGVILTMTDEFRQLRTTTTNSFGFYRFDNVQVGETYIFGIRGKNYSFTQRTQVLSINDETNNINFLGIRSIK